MNIKNVALPMLALSAIGLVGCTKTGEVAGDKARDDIINNTNISAKDLSKLDDAAPSLDLHGDVSAYWTRIDDSLKLKGKVDSAYNKGAQMVRDSVKAANASKIVK